MRGIERVENSGPTDFPPSYEGVTEEVFEDLIKNRTQFVAEALGNLHEENEVLHSQLITNLMIAPDRDLATDWALTYYEIHSRSAAQARVPMIKVSDEVLNAKADEEVDVLSRSQAQGLEATIVALQNMEAQTDAVREEDYANPELARYWAARSMFELTQVHDLNPARSKAITSPADTIAVLLHRQRNANRLNRDFKP